jgi:hypothetical protein
MRNTIPLSALIVFSLSPFITSPARATPGEAAPGSVNGRVIQADGKPAAGASVLLVRAPDAATSRAANAASEAGGDANSAPAMSATVGRDGTFRMNNVPPGRYTATARKGGATGSTLVYVLSGKAARAQITLSGNSEPARPGQAAKETTGSDGVQPGQPRERSGAAPRRNADGGKPLPRNSKPLPGRQPPDRPATAGR